jgi:hypothetical protein
MPQSLRFKHLRLVSSCIRRDEATQAVPDEDNMGRIDQKLLAFSRLE